MTDTKDNTWCRVLCKAALGGKKDGNKLEAIWRSAGFPPERDLTPQHPHYWIYRRL